MFFFYSCGAMLTLTSGAKFISAFGHAGILAVADPLIAITFRKVLLIAAVVEALVAVLCFLRVRIGLKAAAVAWLGSSFVCYRMGLLWIGYKTHCSCLGNITDALHISPNTADNAMKAVLTYLLMGSWGTLIWIWWQRRSSPSINSLVERKVS